jgi:AraC family transcriptional regulator
MNPYFLKITDVNKSDLLKPVYADIVYYAELNEWYGDNSFRSFGLKYVIENYISYKAGKKEYLLKAGDFMVNTKQPSVESVIDSRNQTKDICININNETVDEAFTIIMAKDDYRLDDYLSKHFKSPILLEAVCSAKTAPLINESLQGLVRDIKTSEVNETLNKEWFLELVERIIYNEYGNYLSLNGLRSVKTSTKREILLRLKSGKQYIDDNFLTIQDTAEVAAACNFSEFHFFRSFKQAFAITPYQYILKKKLELAKSLLSSKEIPIKKIAAQCNFADLATFSKAFKRKYGVAPTGFYME